MAGREGVVDGEASGVGRGQGEAERGVLVVEGGEDVADGWVGADADHDAVGLGRGRRRTEYHHLDPHRISVWCERRTGGVDMGFRGREFAFDSPGAAVAAMVARVCGGPPVELEAVELGRSLGRVLGESVACEGDSPAFDYSAMDGFAVRAAEVAGRSAGVELGVVGESRIGREPGYLPPGASAVRIATGAPMPAGADAVVRREDVREPARGAGAERIIIEGEAARRVGPGDFVRRRGENARAGDVVLRAGEVVTPAALGTLASVGSVRPRVFRAVRVVVVSTGDEIVAPERDPGGFQVRDSNAAAIGGVLGSRAWIDVVGIVRVDDSGELAGVIRGAVDEGADAVVLSGGVSMGHRDGVRAGVEEVGADIMFHGLPQRPGKPMLGAMLARAGTARDAVIFGLPGNPVSSLVTCRRVVLAVLAACAGATREPGLAPRLVEVANPDGRNLDLWWHRPARLMDGARVELVDVKGSGDIIAAGGSDGFVEIPPGGSAGGRLEFYPWGG